MKILNLYSGIGGNRKMWGDEHKITAIENNPKIAAIYQDFFPKDKVIVCDAHQYLLEHFEEYDIIWSSPPCPSHSRLRKNFGVSVGTLKPIYPSMTLYQEIILLKHHFKGKWVIENVVAYYKPLIKPTELARHWFWTNFHIGQKDFQAQDIRNIKRHDTLYGFNIGKYELDKDYNHVKILRNMVNPYLGLHILNESKRDIQGDLFK